jgi:prepilin-type processing-associated H-X9-DG protein
LLPLARAAGVNLPTGLLPDPDSVAEFMTPGARVSWYDASGVHQAGRSAFPGAELIGGNPGGSTVVMGVAVGAAVALPALARARTQATVAVDATNLKGISIACLMYSNDKGKMPDDFAQLVAAGTLQPRMLVGARTGTPPLVMTPELEKLAKDDPAKFAEQVAEHCDFVYLGKGSSIATDAASVLAYDKPGPWASNGLNLAFGDGHVEFVNWGGMDSAFQATNESLKKRGVPAVDVQGLLRQAGAAAPVPMRTVPNLP